MAEGTYFDPYVAMDATGGMIPPINGYRTQAMEHYDPSMKSTGFYTDQYAQHHQQHQISTATTLPHYPMGGVEPITVMPMGNHDYSTALSALFEHSANFPLKAEPRQHMPPTPPGSPDDPKEINPGSLLGGAGLGMSHGAPSGDNMLAKPVPVKRLSEKCIAQARACLTTVSMATTEPKMSTPISPTSAIAHAMAMSQQTTRRPRSEKKPIPNEQKDEKYYDRRKRNNNAAKKSRDSRKAREDEIAIRASFLEKENAILRAQVATLREEANSLRQLLLQKRSQV